ELTGGDLTFAGGKKLTIDGPGANQLTISGGKRNATIHVSKGATLDVSGLSFKKSETSINAFLFNEGTFKLTNSIISNNKTTVSIFRTSHGGGIDNEGKLTVTNSTFSNNKAVSSSGTSFGGGIYNTSAGTLAVATSTFSDNKANGQQNGQGGGIDNEGKLTVTQSTFSNN